MISRLDKYFGNSVKRYLKILPREDQTKIVFVTIFQCALSLLDLFGILAVGLLGSTILSEKSTNIPEITFFNNLGFSRLAYEPKILILGGIAISLLVGRTIVSMFVTRRIMFFFSRRAAKITTSLISKLLSQSILALQRKTNQDYLYSVTRGVDFITIQILATGVVMVADLSLLFVMGMGLLFIDPLTAVGTTIVFFVVGFIQHKKMHRNALEYGVKKSNLNISSNDKIIEAFTLYRESVVRNRRYFYTKEIESLRYKLAEVDAELYYMPYVNKYVVETSVILGALIVGSIQFTLHDSATAIVSLSVFLAAGSRIAPAVIRAQQGFLQIKSSIGLAAGTIEVLDSLKSIKEIEFAENGVAFEYEGFMPTVQIDDLTLTYPESNSPAVSDINLNISAGRFVAFVGNSGAGKSTLIDAVLGIIDPDKGAILISGLSPQLAFSKWAGAVSYVPQTVVTISATIRENVSLGYSLSAIYEERIWEALKIAQLDSFVGTLPDGLDTKIGEGGVSLSGGQRQRLGIARALFTNPKILVLDEATSSLDSETEAAVSTAIQVLRGKTTILMITHSANLIKDADEIFTLKQGRIVPNGTYVNLEKID
jgi:ABC-type multidrug transport system fused ATPase/permease subunit